MNDVSWSGPPYRNRADAGRELAEALRRYRSEHPIVLGLPRGGFLWSGRWPVRLGPRWT